MMLAARIPGILRLQVGTLVNGQKVLLVPDHWQVSVSDLRRLPGYCCMLEVDLPPWTILEVTYDDKSASLASYIWNFVSRQLKKLRNLV